MLCLLYNNHSLLYQFFYKLNTNNEIIKVILKFDFELANTIAKLEEEKKSIIT